MVSYTAILKKAFDITRQHLSLWLFGLFLFGGFNLVFLRVLGITVNALEGVSQVQDMLLYFQVHPGKLALISAAVLVVAAGGLIVTNGAKILLILRVKALLDPKATAAFDRKKTNREATAALWPVIRVSLLTSAALLVVAGVLFGPPLYVTQYVRAQTVLWIFSVVIFLLLGFIISALNILTSLFIIVFKTPAPKSFVLATDLFVARWPVMLALAGILMIIYSAGFLLGAGFVDLIKFVLQGTLGEFVQLGLMSSEMMLLVTRLVPAVLLWLVFSGLNVFFHVSTLLLFLELVKPIDKDKEEAPTTIPSVAAT